LRHPLVLQPARIGGLSAAEIDRWKNTHDWLLIPFGEVASDYLQEISAYIDGLGKDDQGVVIDASRFFEKSPWKPPAITNKHLPIILGIALNRWENKQLVKLLRKLSPAKLWSWPALQLDYEKAYHLLYKYSEYYYQACVLVTDFCNLRCEMCMFHSDNDAAYEFRQLRRQDRVQQEIPSESMFSYIDQVLPGAGILFSASGELLMSKRALEYIEYAAKQGKSPFVITNGMLLTPEVSARLLAAGVSHFIVSVEGHNEDLYRKKRRGGDFSRVLEHIEALRRLIEKKNFKATIDVNAIFFEDLEPHKNAIIDFWRDKVDQLAFLVERLDYIGRPRKLFMEPAPVRLCLEPMSGPLLLSNGLIAPCCSVAIAEWFEPMEWLMDSRKTSLAEALKTYRLMMLEDASPLRQYCNRCHYWANSFWQNDRSPFFDIYKFEKPQTLFRKIKNAVGLWE
jgi:pyruvate-formate lyase-activating enzyme